MRPLAISLLSLCLSCSIIGCAVGPDFVRPDAPHLSEYTQGAKPTPTISADGEIQYLREGGSIIPEWWRLFKSHRLDGLITAALANNPSLQAAEASLRQSQELLSAGYGIFYPQIALGAGASRQEASQVRLGGNPNTSIFNLFTLTSTVNYALDIFGGNRRMAEGLQAQVDYQGYILQGAHLTLIGNIINTVIAQAAYNEQIGITEQIIALQKEQIAIAERQAQAGIIAYSNVISLKSQLSNIEASLPVIRQRFNQSRHLLATLSGKAPSDFISPEINMNELTLPSDLPLSLPSELVRQRPDILASEAQLHNASALVGVATASLYPNLTLNASYGYNSNATTELLKNSSSIWSLGANIAAPIFQGGALSAQRRAALESYERALANYRQTVLNAFQQTADNLRSLENDAETLDAQKRALAYAADAMNLIRTNYESGMVNYLQLLNANQQYLQAKTGYIQAKAQRLQDTVGFFTAMGGGLGILDTEGK